MHASHTAALKQSQGDEAVMWSEKEWYVSLYFVYRIQSLVPLAQPKKNPSLKSWRTTSGQCQQQ